jgi:hypothetical protein
MAAHRVTPLKEQVADDLSYFDSLDRKFHLCVYPAQALDPHVLVTYTKITRPQQSL